MGCVLVRILFNGALTAGAFHAKQRPMAKERVLVAMSGGVDSSVTAGLLQEQGYDVVGVTLHLWDAQGKSQVGRCCAPEDRDDARRSCDHLAVPHYVIDEREAFRRTVVDPFVVSNRAGQTPSPCVACNQHVKLTRLWELAKSFGASYLATGHYVRLRRGPSRTSLLRGLDENKDQSYFLYGVPQEVLAHLICPLGELVKDDSREAGRRLGLPNWDKPDSQELCFVPDGDVRGFIEEDTGVASAPGDIVDTDGTVLGQHEGIEGYTVGQRRGLGVSAAAARYVLRVIPERNAVVVGDRESLTGGHLEADQACWTEAAPVEPFRAQVRIRYRHRPAPALVVPTRDGFRVDFDDPQSAIAPGQAAVIYQGERVVGGGFIRA